MSFIRTDMLKHNRTLLHFNPTLIHNIDNNKNKLVYLIVMTQTLDLIPPPRRDWVFLGHISSFWLKDLSCDVMQSGVYAPPCLTGMAVRLGEKWRRSFIFCSFYQKSAVDQDGEQQETIIGVRSKAANLKYVTMASMCGQSSFPW